MMPFSGVEYTHTIGASPAAVNLRTGMLYVNPDVFYQYPPEWRKFIILHEAGHLVLQTFNEHDADAFAFYHFQVQGHSLKDAVFSLKKVLDEGNPAHAERIKIQLEKAHWWDDVVYNKISKKPEERKIAMSDYLTVESTALAHCIGCNDQEGAMRHMTNILIVVDPRVEGKLLDKFSNVLANMRTGIAPFAPESAADQMAYFFCFGNKACQARAKAKTEAKAALIKSKGTAKELRAQANLTRAEGKKALNEQGISQSGVGDVFKGLTDLGKTVGGIMTGQPMSPDSPVVETPAGLPTPTEEPKKSNTGLYIGIGAVVLVLIIIAAVVLMRRKKQAA